MGFVSKRSFTLVELVVIISVLSVLIAFSVPAITMVINKVHRVKAAHHLRSIAHAHAEFIRDFGHPIRFCDLKDLSGSDKYDVNTLAAVMARYGYIRDISVWAWDFDPLVKKYQASHTNSGPKKMYHATSNSVEDEFKGKSLGGDFPTSLTCAIVECPNFDYTDLIKGKYVIAYSRGLKPNGKWEKNITSDNGGVFSDKGGLIAYFDGTVEWCTNTVNKFTNYLTQEQTSQVCKSLPNNHLSIRSSPQFTDSNFVNWVSYNACD